MIAERNQVMGHSRAEIFDKYYVSHVVRTDLQSAYLGTPSKVGLLRLAGRMDLTRDPTAKSAVGGNCMEMRWMF